MDEPGSSTDIDDAFLRLREVLGAPDRRGWRRHLPRRVPHAVTRAGGEGRSPTHPRLVVLAALPLLGAAGVLLVSIARPAAPGPIPPSTASTTPSSTSAPIVESSEAPDPAPAPLPQQVWPGAQVAMGEGGEVRIGRQRWSVGTAGDVVVVGDWDCDRQPTPAVLRPRTGGFYVFDGWAAPGEPALARKVVEVPGAVTAVAAGCGSAVVRTTDGRERRITTDVAQ